MPRVDPYSAFNFLVVIDDVTAAGFSEVSGLDSRTEIIEYREGADVSQVRKLPGLTKYSDIVLKRGFTDNRDLWEWRLAVIDGHTERKSGTITMLDEAREPAVAFSFSEGWPCSWSGPVFDANRSSVAIETLVICHEGVVLE